MEAVRGEGEGRQENRKVSEADEEGVRVEEEAEKEDL